MGVLDTPAEERFDRLTRLARRLFRVPVAMVTLLDGPRQWFKSAQGHTIAETPRAESFCAHTILEPRPLVVPDASIDERFFDLPVVRGEMGVRFYAGVPISNEEGQQVGTLCVLDTQPRQLSGEELASLVDLGACVESEFRIQRYTQSERELLAEMDVLRRKASIDPTTRCWNAQTILELLEKELVQYRIGKHALAILLLEVDSLEETNRMFGSPMGDALLRETADRLRRCIGPRESLGRHHGARFLIISPGPVDELQKRADKLMANLLSDEVRINNHLVPYRVLAGFAFSRGHHEPPAKWLARAEKALLSARPENPLSIAI